MGTAVLSVAMLRLLFLVLIYAYSGWCTDRPIIGILSQWYPNDYFHDLPEAANYTTYLAASYVKWIEAAGAQVVPIIVDDTAGTVDKTEYFKEIFSGINGLVIPGGGNSLTESGYAVASNQFFEMAVEANDNGDIFPIWGTCLGFEMLGLISIGGERYLKRCNSIMQPLPLEMEEGWNDSKLFGEAPEEIMDEITSLSVTLNNHRWCLTKENFTKFEMGNFWKLLSVNKDLDGLEFVSSMESLNYPIYATQFHPEKNSFEWASKYEDWIPHSREATSVSHYFSEFFINMARKNGHSFPSRAVEESHLIYNHKPFFVGRDGTNNGFTQIYLFNS